MSGISNIHEDEVPTLAEQDAIRSIAKLFHGKSDDEFRGLAGEFLRNTGLDESLLAIFEKGAMLAQQPDRRGNGLDLTQTEAKTLRDEKEKKWNISGTLLSLVIVCSMSAAVQGMDETAVNGGEQHIRFSIKSILCSAACYIKRNCFIVNISELRVMNTFLAS